MVRQQVLVVDDDPGIRQLLRAGLESYAFAVLTAENTAQAKEQLRTAAVSLVLCDQEMPGGNGLDLLRYVATVYPHLPFLMVTGQDEMDLARESIAAGALDFVTKPFQIDALVRQIEQCRVRVERDRLRLAQATEEVLGGTVRALVAAVDAKDPHTARHSERVTALALALGEALGLTEELGILTYAGLLHDVGKIAVPEHILTKPGQLDAEEWRIIQRHPGRSAEILQQVPALAEVATIVRHHHECLDGQGYPDGLVGEAIPFLTRLLTIADVYEAVTADRAYRRVYSATEAKRVLWEGRGTAFDPDLVSLFNGIETLP
jgi:putative two-component system response regulator